MGHQSKDCCLQSQVPGRLGLRKQVTRQSLLVKSCFKFFVVIAVCFKTKSLLLSQHVSRLYERSRSKFLLLAHTLFSKIFLPVSALGYAILKPLLRPMQTWENCLCSINFSDPLPLLLRQGWAEGAFSSTPALWLLAVKMMLSWFVPLACLSSTSQGKLPLMCFTKICQPGLHNQEVQPVNQTALLLNLPQIESKVWRQLLPNQYSQALLLPEYQKKKAWTR